MVVVCVCAWPSAEIAVMGAKVGVCVKGGDGGVCLAKCRDSSHGCQGRYVCEGG